MLDLVVALLLNFVEKLIEYDLDEERKKFIL